MVFALGVGSSLNRSTESYSRDEPNNDWNLASQTDQTWTAKSQYQKRWGAASNTPHPWWQTVVALGRCCRRYPRKSALWWSRKSRSASTGIKCFPFLRSRLYITTGGVSSNPKRDGVIVLDKKGANSWYTKLLQFISVKYPVMKSAIVLESGNWFNGELAKRSQQTMNASQKIEADTFSRKTIRAKCMKKRRQRRTRNGTIANPE